MKKRPTKNKPATAVKKPAVKKQSSKSLESNELKMVITKNGIEQIPLKPEKKNTNKYIKMLITQSAEEFRLIGERVMRKEIKWAYYTTENNVGVHYYLILNE